MQKEMQIQDSLYIYIIGRIPCQIIVTWEKLLIVRTTVTLSVSKIHVISLERNNITIKHVLSNIFYTQKNKEQK